MFDELNLISVVRWQDEANNKQLHLIIYPYVSESKFIYKGSRLVLDLSI